MFAVVVIIFMVCWAPYHIYFIYSYHNPSITKMPYINHIYLGFYWLAMANTCVNPIIYYWMNRKFRSYFNMVLFCVPRYFRKAATDDHSDNSMARISRITSCPANHRFSSKHYGEATIPVRAMGLKHSLSLGVHGEGLSESFFTNEISVDSLK
jgi:hypothetical protein